MLTKRFSICSIVYTVLLFTVWTIYVLTLYPVVISGKTIPGRIIFNEFIRALIFVAPIILLIKFFYGERPLSFLKLDKNVKTGILWGTVAGVGYAVLVCGRILLTGGNINPKPVSIEAWLTAVSTATLIEEISFRGFLLASFEKVMKFWKANMLTAFLFVAIHFPGWIILSGAPLLSERIVPMLEILFLGLLLGFLFRKSNSLWACVILHAVNNLLSISLFG